MPRGNWIRLLGASLWLVCSAHDARAAWPVTGLPLCTVPEDLEVPIGSSSSVCFPPGCAGQLTLFWQDARSNHGSIYRATVSDVLPPDPPAVVPATLFFERPGFQTPGGVVTVFAQCVSGSQFCFPFASVFVWTDAPDGAPSVVRGRRDGGPEHDWGPDGVIVAGSEGSQHDASVVHDLHGGAIVAWLDETPEHRWVLAQRLDSLGTRLWGPEGLLVGSDTTTQTHPLIAPDGAGGAYILRGDQRGGASTLALFRLAPDGSLSPGWPASGTVVGTLPVTSSEPLLRISGAGAWVVWHEEVTLADESTALRPFVTLVAPDGGISQGFAAAGIPVATGLEGDAIADDASVGPTDDILVVLEYTQRLPAPSPSSTDLVAVRLEVEGSRPAGWPESGLAVCDADGVQRQGRVFRQAGGGAFVAWTDERSGDGDIYAQRLLNDGSVPEEWPASGLLVCGVVGTQQDPVIGPNLVGGGFIAWRDGRDAITNGWDLYAQTVSYDARLEVEHPITHAFALLAPRPNPARGPVRFTLELPASGSVRLDIHDVAGRRVRGETIAVERGARELVWNLANDAGTRVSPGLYIVRVRALHEERTARVFVAR